MDTGSPRKKKEKTLIPTETPDCQSFLKARGYSGHIVFAASARPRATTKNWLGHPLPLLIPLA